MQIILRKTAPGAFQHVSIIQAFQLQLTLQGARAAIETPGYELLIRFARRQQSDEQSFDL